jgi:hypothetical protein
MYNDPPGRNTRKDEESERKQCEDDETPVQKVRVYFFQGGAGLILHPLDPCTPQPAGTNFFTYFVPVPVSLALTTTSLPLRSYNRLSLP